MPIDPTIALQAKNPDIQSPLALQGQYMTLANLGLEGQTAQLKLAEAKRTIADRESLNQAYKSAVTPGGGVDWNSLTQNLVGSGNADQLATVAKLRGTLTNADLTSLKAEKAKRDYINGTIAPIAANPNATQQDVIQALSNTVSAGHMTAQEAAQYAANLPPDGQLHPWLVGKQLESADAAKRLDLMLGDTKIVNTGGAQTPINTNKLTGESTALPPVALNTPTPGNLLAANTAANAQDRADARVAARVANAPAIERAKVEARSGFFTPEEGNLMAALAMKGISLPTGMRSQPQMKSLFSSLLATNPGKSPTEIADLIATGQLTFGADKKLTQTAATQAGKIQVSQNEIQQFGPQVLAASAAVPRKDFVPYSQLKQILDKNLSDPNLLFFKQKMNALENAYDALSARGGTDKDKRAYIHGLFSTANSPEAVAILVKALGEEATGAEKAAQNAMAPPDRNARRAAAANVPPMVPGSARSAAPPTAPPAAQSTAPTALPLTNAQGWTLHQDANGNKAYVGPQDQVQEIN